MSPSNGFMLSMEKIHPFKVVTGYAASLIAQLSDRGGGGGVHPSGYGNLHTSFGCLKPLGSPFPCPMCPDQLLQPALVVPSMTIFDTVSYFKCSAS